MDTAAAVTHASPAAPLPLRPDRKERHIFCDESGLVDRFFILGSLWCPSDPQDFVANLDAIKARHSLRDELKWEKIPKKSGQYLNGYNAVIDSWIESPLLYKALIVDTHRYQLNHPEFTGGAYPIGYYQFYLTLLFNGFIRHDPVYNARILLHTPAYYLTGGLSRLEDKINEASLWNGFPDIAGSSCCRITASSAKGHSLLQLTDLLTGMVSSTWNGRKTCETKRDLVARCSDRLRVDISCPSDSRHTDTKFNRWLFTPRQDKDVSKKWPALYPPTK